jgi:branched-chain amino acid transport system substrate-binding protein
LGAGFGGAAALAAMLASSGAQAQIKLGVAGPITGPNAAFGAQMKNGVEQAIEDINTAGGVLGQMLMIAVGDDMSDPKLGVSVANKFAADGVKHVIGHFNSGVTIPASEVYAENNIIFITPSSTNPMVTERRLWNAFRTCGRDDQQGPIAAEYILKNFKTRKIAIVHDKTIYGQGIASKTKKAINAGGVREVMYAGVNMGQQDFSALVARIKRAQVDFLFWGGVHTELGRIIRQMRDQGLKVTAMGTDAITSDSFVALGGPGTVGTLMTFPPDPRARPQAAAVVKKFEAKKFNPEAYTLYSYAGVEIFKQAAEGAKSLDPKKMAKFMKTGVTFKTVIGDISYNKKGDITRPDYVVYTWKQVGDKITYVQN